MFDSIDSLGQEIINVQLLDLYLKDGAIRTESVFFREDYIYQMQKMENLLKYYKNNNYLNEKEVEYEYTLDNVLELLVSDLDIYALIYNVPEIKLENVEWELLFTTLANYYQKQEFSYFFMVDMIYLNKMVIARAMVYEEDSITLETYISSLKYIESDSLTISNIIEIAKKLQEVFGIDALSLLENEDGSYGCIGKDSELFILDEEFSEFSNEKIKEYLKQQGYTINETVEIKTDNNHLEHNDSIKNEKVVDIQTYKKERRK